ncbi:DASH complex subunit DAD2 [Penicillium alfredii]|uniref:DASH complex subunit DAD2 n=1 Tax=Penicillium alfredii TaxID=1506179 RepID=A0A9W9ER00_9EURO|nr:DASH complex subunit DAD2 [Penicillium alfredii]KAJ5086299.1 DASH complex subunit DAD2 [Penicillium alfredii]
MAYSSRPTSMLPGPGASLRGASQPTSQQSSALSARIAAKKDELENLQQLRDLSGTLAMQMQALETKVSTLKDGTEAVACVLSNWDNVLRAISLASKKAGSLPDLASSETKSGEDTSNESRLPATLVRIPAEQREKTNDGLTLRSLDVETLTSHNLLPP